MKLFITSLLFIFSLSVFAQEDDSSPVCVSKELYKGKPVLLFTQYNSSEYFVFLRTEKQNFEYKLKYEGGHTQGGITEMTFSAFDKNGKIQNLTFLYEVGSIGNKLLNSITLTLTDPKTQKSQNQKFELKTI